MVEDESEVLDSPSVLLELVVVGKTNVVLSEVVPSVIVELELRLLSLDVIAVVTEVGC